MKIYQTPEGVEQYCKMAEGYDFSRYRDRILKHMPEGRKLLEIGMGPGNDFAWLSSIYRTTGTDYSPVFINRARERFPGADLRVLDGIALDTDEKYDGIFSCKVYQHIPLGELKEVFKGQSRILTDRGVIIHSFWIGGKIEDMDDMRFYYHDEKALLASIEEYFTIVDMEKYTEFEDGDSLFIIGVKK